MWSRQRRTPSLSAGSEDPAPDEVSPGSAPVPAAVGGDGRAAGARRFRDLLLPARRRIAVSSPSTDSTRMATRSTRRRRSTARCRRPPACPSPVHRARRRRRPRRPAVPRWGRAHHVRSTRATGARASLAAMRPSSHRRCAWGLRASYSAALGRVEVAAGHELPRGRVAPALLDRDVARGERRGEQVVLGLAQHQPQRLVAVEAAVDPAGDADGQSVAARQFEIGADATGVEVDDAHGRGHRVAHRRRWTRRTRCARSTGAARGSRRRRWPSPTSRRAGRRCRGRRRGSGRTSIDPSTPSSPSASIDRTPWKVGPWNIQ